MSCQTTEMDGYEAARAIRSFEGNSCHTPVIALTSSTMQCDRKKREEAGMDDYISLPINPFNWAACASLEVMSWKVSGPVSRLQSPFGGGRRRGSLVS